MWARRLQAPTRAMGTGDNDSQALHFSEAVLVFGLPVGTAETLRKLLGKRSHLRDFKTC